MVRLFSLRNCSRIGFRQLRISSHAGRVSATKPVRSSARAGRLIRVAGRNRDLRTRGATEGLSILFASNTRKSSHCFSKGRDMRNGLLTVLAGAGMAVFATSALATEPTQVERVQAAVDAWLAARAPIEKVTGIAAYISFGTAGPAIEAFAGKVGRNPDSARSNLSRGLRRPLRRRP